MKTSMDGLSKYMPHSELVVDRQIIQQPKFLAIDFHVHLIGPLVLRQMHGEGFDLNSTIAKFKACGVRHVVNLEMAYGDILDLALARAHPYQDFISTFGSVNLEQFEAPGFEQYIYQSIRDLKAKGVKGLKFWKHLGLVYKDKSGRYLRVDDPRLQVIWQTAAEFELPVLIHVADPTAFFKPVDATNERYEELKKNPEWSFYGEGRYTFQELMEQQTNLLKNNPKTTFVVPHGGAYAENLKQVGEWLDAFPNMYIDMAARLGELGRQPYTARKFFMTYQDRILFGTDTFPYYSFEYRRYYEFLETWNEFFPYTTEGIPVQGRWNIYGIGLADDVLAKVYYQNAEKLLRLGR